MSEKTSPDDTNYAALPLLRRLFAEHGRPHIRSYIVAGLLMGIGAATTALSAWLLKPILNHMVDADGC
jgi:ATP-binding cassette subfamily B protein